jgi:hypothetical protein
LIIAVDFDGTIVKDRWPEIGPFRWGAKWCLKWLQKRGHILILWTCREDWYGPKPNLLHNAYNFLIEQGIFIPYKNANSIDKVRIYGGDCRKISADWYIDDKAGFLGWWSIPIIIMWLEWKQGGYTFGKAQTRIRRITKKRLTRR